MNVDKAKVMRIPKQSSAIQITMDKKQPENVECFSYLGSMVTNDARFISEIKSRIDMAKAAFIKNKNLFMSKFDLNLRKKLERRYIWCVPLYAAENLILWKLDQNYLESFKMW